MVQYNMGQSSSSQLQVRKVHKAAGEVQEWGARRMQCWADYLGVQFGVLFMCQFFSQFQSEILRVSLRKV